MGKKVWNTKIDDDEEQPKRPAKKTRREIFLDDLTSDKKTDDDEEGDKALRLMIRLDDFNATISAFGIECIEKVSRFKDTPRPRWQYGISINGGVEPSVRYPKTDLYAWYEKESYRDKRYNELLASLNEYGVKVTTI